MQNLARFPQTIKTPRLELRTVVATEENATTLLRIINENRDHLEAWQGHFAELRSVDNVVAYLTKRANQINTNEGICFYVYHNDEIIGRIRFFHVHDNECEIGYWLARSAAGHGCFHHRLGILRVPGCVQAGKAGNTLQDHLQAFHRILQGIHEALRRYRFQLPLSEGFRCQ